MVPSWYAEFRNQKPEVIILSEHGTKHQQAAERVTQYVILRSRRRRRISARVNLTGTEILRSAQNDTDREYFSSLLCTKH